MRLLYISAIEETAGWGAEASVNEALRALGVETTTLDFRRHRWRLSDQFLKLPEFDALFLQRGDYFPLDLLEACRRPRFFWASELVSRRRDQHHLLRSGLFDHVFVRTQECRRILAERGWVPPDKSSILLSAYDHRVHRPLPGVEKTIDVLFAGSLTPRRDRILKQLGSRFNVDVRTGVFGHDLVLLFNRARIVLNIHATDHLDTETRVYEALGSGSFLLSEPLSQECPFERSIHLVTAAFPTEMERAIEYYLEDEARREEIASRGHRAAAKEHTYEARAEAIFNIISGHVKPNDSPSEALDRAAVRKFQRREATFNTKRLLTSTAERIVGKLRRIGNRYLRKV